MQNAKRDGSAYLLARFFALGASTSSTIRTSSFLRTLPSLITFKGNGDDETKAKALTLFEEGQRVAAQNGLILVDTKYEFGVDRHGRILLVDELHTPDSSRYWIAGEPNPPLFFTPSATSSQLLIPLSHLTSPADAYVCACVRV